MIGPEATGRLAARMAEYIEREIGVADEAPPFFKRADFNVDNAAQIMADYARLGLKEYEKMLEFAKITESGLTQLVEQFREKAGLNQSWSQSDIDKWCARYEP